MSSQETARIVIVGGGVIGLSIAYHLAKLGLDDVLLLERNRLTSGTSWHAAGHRRTAPGDHERDPPRRPTGTGATTSARTTRRSKPAWGSP